jgi:hypothetical protein
VKCFGWLATPILEPARQSTLLAEGGSGLTTR